jgi:hypothetical protein
LVAIYIKVVVLLLSLFSAKPVFNFTSFLKYSDVLKESGQQ